MIEPEKTCLNCFKQLNEPKGVCPHCGCDNAQIENESHQLECGSILAGTYLIGKVLGQGGFGITYVAWDLNLNIKVAIKEYYPEGFVSRNMSTRTSVLTYTGEKESVFQKGRERFVSEAKTLARLGGDKGIVNVRSFFQENGTAYIVMDFAEGETLKGYVARRGGKLAAQEALKLFEPLLLTLEHIHGCELLHRDISPDNIILRPDGTLVLLDFGASRQMSVVGEHSNTVNVKHGYAPEEQYRTRGEQGPWTDLYALAATIYRLTTGVTPPQALDRMADETLMVPPTQLGAAFTPAQEAALLHALAVRIVDRTQSVAAFREELYEGKADGAANSAHKTTVHAPQPDRAATAHPAQTGAAQTNAVPIEQKKRGESRIKIIAIALFVFLGIVAAGFVAFFFMLKSDGAAGNEIQLQAETMTDTPILSATPTLSPVPTASEAVETTPEPTEGNTVVPLNSWLYEQGSYRATLSNDGQTWTAQLSGVNVKDSYKVNFMEQYYQEYCWEIGFEIKDDLYIIGTSYYCGLYPSKNTVSINEMQSQVLKEYEKNSDGTTKSFISDSDAILSIDGNTLTWTFYLDAQFEPNDVGIDYISICENGVYYQY
jgi:hypothetical protein